MERIPVLRMGTLLLITIQVDMHDKLAMQLQDDVTQRISEWGSTGVLIDISSLEIVDSFIGRMLANIAAMSRVSGSRNGRCGDATGSRHHAGRAGNVTSRSADGTERRSGNGVVVWKRSRNELRIK